MRNKSGLTKKRFTLLILIIFLFLSSLVFISYLDFKSEYRWESSSESTTLEEAQVLGEISEGYYVNLQIPYPSKASVDWEGLETAIREVLGSEVDKYAIYIDDFGAYGHLGINEAKIFLPASVYKVPLAMVVLKDVDDGKTTLEHSYLVTDSEKKYDFDVLSEREGNYNISLDSLLDYLIRYSDNTAMTTLEHRFGGVYNLQGRMVNELGVITFTRLPHQVTAKDVASVFQVLYEDDYLSEESRDYLLNLLKTVVPWLNDRIPAGIPEEIEVAHKIGNLEGVHQDAGIVFGKERDYIIVILNKNINPGTAREKVKQIAELSYEYVGK